MEDKDKEGKEENPKEYRREETLPTQNLFIQRKRKGKGKRSGKIIIENIKKKIKEKEKKEEEEEEKR